MANSAVNATADASGSTSGNYTHTSANAAAGDVIVVVIAERSSTDKVTAIKDTATGLLAFTKYNFFSIATSASISVWYRVVQAGDPTGAGGWTVTNTGGVESLMQVYRGVDTTTPIEAASATNTSSGTALTW